MQPDKTAFDGQTVAQIWDRFVRTGRVAEPDMAVLDPAVLRSWRRCIYRFDPLARPRSAPIGAVALTSILRAQQELITVGTPFLEDIYQFTEGSRYAILLTDGAACILAIGGDPATVEELSALGFQQGMYLSEEIVGTNAFGLVLTEAMPIQIVGAEHYFSRFHDLVSTAAPIHDVRGRIIGALGMIGPHETASSHTLGLVMAAARAVGNLLQADWYLQEANHRLSEMNTILEAVTEGVVVWNERGEIRHVNEKAAQLLHLNPRTVVGRSAYEVMALPGELVDAVNAGTEVHEAETTFTVRGRRVSCLVTLRPIRGAGGEPVSYVALLTPIESVRRIVQQQVGMQTSLTIEDIQAESAAMRRVVRQARTAARGTAPVLIRGEGGVGKNLLARAIHNDSQRCDGPFIDINCRAIPHELMSREILGQEKDMHTRGQPSKFELADGGTLLLDQVDSLSLELQAALLHVIETQHVMRLGSPHPIPVDVRIIATTTADLEQLVTEGSFMPHLYYRFGVFNLLIPPLRERTDDIPLLAERFLARVTEREERAVWIDDQTVQMLHRYPWPGNVRELESALERAVSQSHDGVIRPSDLPEVVRNGRVLTGASPWAQPVMSVSEAEREAILRAGWACNGRVQEMARLLGIGRSTLWRKMRAMDIPPEYFKS